MLVPVGAALGLLTHSWSTLLVCVFATILVGVAPYMGQGHNEVLVGPRGVRRVARDCDLIATWPSLRAVEVKVPGNRIVVFTLETAGVLVERLTKDRDRAKPAQALVRHPPEGSNSGWIARPLTPWGRRARSGGRISAGWPNGSEPVVRRRRKAAPVTASLWCLCVPATHRGTLTPLRSPT